MPDQLVVGQINSLETATLPDLHTPTPVVENLESNKAPRPRRRPKTETAELAASPETYLTLTVSGPMLRDHSVTILQSECVRCPRCNRWQPADALNFHLTAKH